MPASFSEMLALVHLAVGKQSYTKKRPLRKQSFLTHSASNCRKLVTIIRLMGKAFEVKAFMCFEASSALFSLKLIIKH